MKRIFIYGGLSILLLLLIMIAYSYIQGQECKDERRIELLETALAPKTAEAAAYDWAEAIKTRNGAWQYALMNEQLKEEYLPQFEESNWVTGFSSPWVADYTVSREEDEVNDVKFKIKFDWYTSDGYEYSNFANLTASKFGLGPDAETWLITYLDYSYEPGSKN